MLHAYKAILLIIEFYMTNERGSFVGTTLTLTHTSPGAIWDKKSLLKKTIMKRERKNI